ncbi:hypothetical protein B0O99DRAFT_654986 [Bisporella sp. PMI_857]|nr:hypothetical protein B0O99DRAFT_654986 [Bisporella sp. PMI_857]
MGKFSKRKEGKIVGNDAGWGGSKNAKNFEAPSKAKNVAVEKVVQLEPLVPLKLQQSLLDIYRDAFPELRASDSLQKVLQDVKGALYERDFNRAFRTARYLEAYALRWSPGRALAYTSILVELKEQLMGSFKSTLGHEKKVPGPSIVNASPSTENFTEHCLRAVCFGGGAAEVIGFGGFLSSLKESFFLAPDSDKEEQTNSSTQHQEPKVDLTLVDSASWQEVVTKLESGLVTLPTLSKYANASAREANAPLLQFGSMTTTFQQENALTMTKLQLTETVGKIKKLITLFFTLNELYAASIGKTTTFLLYITELTISGTYLLVVDSPGSYSETSVGSEAKKYPMKWLLDHTLLKNNNDQNGAARWEKVVSEDSKWFRLPESLRYPIPLENMRYQIHLYRRL